MWRQIQFLVCFIVLVRSEQSRSHEGRSRTGRLFTFNTVDDDIKLELQFTIPFITIPAKKAIDSVHGIWSGGVPTVNINPATLAVGGAIVLGTTVLLPFALKSYAQHNAHHEYSRLLDSAEFSTDAFIDFAGQLLLSNGQSVRGCTLRVACWTSQMSKMDYVRTLQDITSNSLLSTVINATAVEEAMMSGRKGRDCSTFGPCPLRKEHIPVLFSYLASFVDTVGKG